MEDINQILDEQQKELERIRSGRRGRKWDNNKIRKVLNILFMALALVGVVLYFFYPEYKYESMMIIAFGMLLKIVEFFLRFMF